MSVSVALSELDRAVAQRDYCFVITVAPATADHGERPRVVSARVVVDGDALVVEAGRSAATNVATNSDVTLCFPPRSPGEMSLLVDGTATAVDDTTLRVAPTSAVLHRAAPGVRSTAGAS